MLLITCQRPEVLLEEALKEVVAVVATDLRLRVDRYVVGADVVQSLLQLLLRHGQKDLPYLVKPLQDAVPGHQPTPYFCSCNPTKPLLNSLN